MEDSNLMDEIFEKIKILEDEQKFLEIELAEANKSLEQKNINLLTQMFSEENNDQESQSSSEYQSKINEYIIKINNCIQQNDQSIQQHQFSYTPIDSSYNSVFISGDFNNWTMKEMQFIANQKNFTITIPLLKGFEYAYCFFSNGELLVDFNKEYKEISHRNKMVHNFLIIPNSDPLIPSVQFNCEKDYETLNNLIINSSIKINGDESDFLKNLSELNAIIQERQKKYSLFKMEKITKVQQSYNLKNKTLKENYDKIIMKFKELFEGRIIMYRNAHFCIKYLEMKEKAIKCMRLYDPNGIKVNQAYQVTTRQYEKVLLNDLFINAIILSKIDSDQLIAEYEKDKSSILKIYYQLVMDKNGKEKDLTPYKIEPDNVDINEYNFVIQDNTIQEVKHRNSLCVICFNPIFIGESKNTSGFVGTSLIKVYTTLYNKDILNILHIHLNDTSEEITIDSVFLEKDENIINHKIFTVDVMGNKLKYKFIFRNYKLIQVYYAMSNEFIDEPPFEEIRYNANAIVKISKGAYKNYYARLKPFPIGMLARKDKEKTELQKMKSFGYHKEEGCGDRHLEELPGYVSIEILFAPPNPDIELLSNPITLSLPICNLIPLTPKEEILFEKNIIAESNIQKETQEVNMETLLKEYNDYEQYINNDKLLDNFTLEKLKEILAMLEKDIKINEDFNMIIDESQENLGNIQRIKEKLIPILHQKIRLLILSGKK